MRKTTQREITKRTVPVVGGGMVVSYDLVVVGGGASGLVAAIVAARNGAHVLIIEKNAKLGRKLLATGNGRCNLGNDILSLDNFYNSNLALVKGVLERFGGSEARRFFSELGLVIISEEGRWYPRSKQATSVLEVLLYELHRLGVDVLLNSPVRSLAYAQSFFTVLHATGQAHGRQVLLTTGGMAAPQLGCTGDGYDLAKQFGHGVNLPAPALVGLRLKSEYLKTLSGLRLLAEVSILEMNIAEVGEVIFTDYGVSGIPIFDLTGQVGHRVGLSLRLKLAYEARDEAALMAFWHKRIQGLAHKTIREALVGYLPLQLCLPALAESGVNPDKKAGQLSSAELTRIRVQLWRWDFPIIGQNTWEQAQATWGGIPLDEVHPTTLGSRLQAGLSFAGEILDVHGRCGGYNLHWAFASGFVAANSLR